MATTGFWPVKSNLKYTLDYAENPDKTTAEKCLDNDLYAAIRYVENDDKTDRKLFVTGINCVTERAYECMMSTKKRYGKLGGNLAYHGFQSFAEGEVTPEECHRIGIETAKLMWGDKYEVIVTTHLNTQNHLHNHFVVNSVSFRTGEKFKNKIGDHLELRKISDEICREHEKSVLENASFFGGEKSAYWVHRDGGKTHRDILTEDIERCLESAKDYAGFFRGLKRLGYEVDQTRYSVKVPNWERAIRLNSIGYTNENLKKRFEGNMYNLNSYKLYIPVPKQQPLRKMLREYEYEIKHSNDASTVLVDLVFYLIISLLEAAHERRELQAQAAEICMEYAHINELKREYQFLTDNNIHTVIELEKAIENAKSQFSELEEQRKKEYNRIRRPKSTEDKELHKQKRSELSAQMKPLRDFIKTAEKINERYKALKPMLDMEKRMERASIERSRDR
ncbi:MAG: relaxase/mobilization nuclease domain-containing protein [Clostridia bacterium]|nr:relaxase/mobilization nuclease domain-containing protein [Clostridia bacterium]